MEDAIVLKNRLASQLIYCCLLCFAVAGCNSSAEPAAVSKSTLNAQYEKTLEKYELSKKDLVHSRELSDQHFTKLYDKYRKEFMKDDGKRYKHIKAPGDASASQKLAILEENLKRLEERSKKSSDFSKAFGNKESALRKRFNKELSDVPEANRILDAKRRHDINRIRLAEIEEKMEQAGILP